MRKIATILIFTLSTVFAFGQYALDYGINGGASNYLGDIGGGSGDARGFILDMKLKKSQLALGGFVRYKFLPSVSGRASLNWLRIGGDDKLSDNPGRRARNLSFRNDIIELSLTGEFVFFQFNDVGRSYTYRNDFKLYAFAGFAAFYHNPKALYNGSWVNLRPLQTEKVEYKAISYAVPAGLGMYLTIARKNRIGFEISGRMSFSDYLDDVSSTYPNPNGMSAEAKALSNRRPELGTLEGIVGELPAAQYYGYQEDAEGNDLKVKRGNPKNKDAYISGSVYYSRVIRGKSSFYKSKYGGLFKSRKNKKRKVRAKF